MVPLFRVNLLARGVAVVSYELYNRNLTFENFSHLNFLKVKHGNFIHISHGIRSLRANAATVISRVFLIVIEQLLVECL